MQTVLSKIRIKGKGTTTFPKFNIIQKGIRDNIDSAKAYFRANNESIDSSHLLIKLLYAMDVSDKLSLQQQYDTVSHTAYDIAAGLSIATSLMKPKTYTNNFFESGVTEVYVMENDSFPIDMLFATDENHWMTLKPVGIKYHPFTTILPVRLDGSYGGPRIADYSVFTIDLPLLALMYKGWLTYNALLPAELQETAQMFLSKYVLPQMYDDFIDISIVNRYIAHMDYTDIEQSDTTLPIFMIDYERKLMKHIRHVLDISDRKAYDVSQVLATIPLVSADSLIDVLPIIELANMKQINWILVLTHLPYLYLLASFVFMHPNKDTTFKYTFNSANKKLKSSNMLNACNNQQLRDTLNIQLGLISSYLL